MRVKCYSCNKPMKPRTRVMEGDNKYYCGHKCAVFGQPEKVLRAGQSGDRAV